MLQNHNHKHLSFKNAQEMRNKLLEMEGGPQWHCTTIQFDEAPNEPCKVYYRNVLECAMFKLQNPTFNGHMCFAPCKVFTSMGKHAYHEMWTGDEWQHIQVCQIILSVASY